MNPKLDAGKLWVNAKIRELSESKHTGAIAFEWEDPSNRRAEDFMRGTISLALLMGADRRVIRIKESDLEDVEGSPEVQAQLLTRLKEALR